MFSRGSTTPRYGVMVFIIFVLIAMLFTTTYADINHPAAVNKADCTDQNSPYCTVSYTFGDDNSFTHDYILPLVHPNSDPPGGGSIYDLSILFWFTPTNSPAHVQTIASTTCQFLDPTVGSGVFNYQAASTSPPPNTVCSVTFQKTDQSIYVTWFSLNGAVITPLPSPVTVTIPPRQSGNIPSLTCTYQKCSVSVPLYFLERDQTAYSMVLPSASSFVQASCTLDTTGLSADQIDAINSRNALHFENNQYLAIGPADPTPLYGPNVLTQPSDVDEFYVYNTPIRYLCQWSIPYFVVSDTTAYLSAVNVFYGFFRDPNLTTSHSYKQVIQSPFTIMPALLTPPTPSAPSIALNSDCTDISATICTITLTYRATTSIGLFADRMTFSDGLYEPKSLTSSTFPLETDLKDFWVNGELLLISTAPITPSGIPNFSTSIVLTKAYPITEPVITFRSGANTQFVHLSPLQPLTSTLTFPEVPVIEEFTPSSTCTGASFFCLFTFKSNHVVPISYLEILVTTGVQINSVLEPAGEKLNQNNAIYTFPTPVQFGEDITFQVQPSALVAPDITKYRLTVLSSSSAPESPSPSPSLPIPFEFTSQFTFTPDNAVRCASVSDPYCVLKVAAPKKGSTLVIYDLIPPAVFIFTENQLTQASFTAVANIPGGVSDVTLPLCSASMTFSAIPGTKTSYLSFKNGSNTVPVCYFVIKKANIAATTGTSFKETFRSNLFYSDVGTLDIPLGTYSLPIQPFPSPLFCNDQTSLKLSPETCQYTVPLNNYFLTPSLATAYNSKVYTAPSTDLTTEWANLLKGKSFTCSVKGGATLFTLNLPTTADAAVSITFVPNVPAMTEPNCTFQLPTDIIATPFIDSDDANFSLQTDSSSSFIFKLPPIYSKPPFEPSFDPDFAPTDGTAPYTLTFSAPQWAQITSIHVNIIFDGQLDCLHSTGFTIARIDRQNIILQTLTQQQKDLMGANYVCTFPNFPLSGLGEGAYSLSYNVKMNFGGSDLDLSIPASFPIYSYPFQMTSLDPCIGKPYCSFEVKFASSFESVSLPGNHFGLLADEIYECHTRDELIATVEWVDDSTDANQTPGFTKITPTAPSAGLNCFVSLPIRSRLTPQERVKPILTFPNNGGTSEATSILLPHFVRYEIISLVPRVCRIGQLCEYTFQIGPVFLDALVLFQFDSKFDGTWELMDSNYCAFTQQGRHIAVQLKQGKKYFSDVVPSCTFHVTPLQSTIEPEDLLSGFSKTLDMNIYALNGEAAELPDKIAAILASKGPIPYDPKLGIYRHSLIIPKWVVNDIPVFPKATSSGSLMQVATADADGCVGRYNCRITYTFLAANVVSTVRFVNYFLIQHPTTTLACTDGNNKVIGLVTVSPQLRYLYLSSTDPTGFARSQCTVEYAVVGTKASLDILHQYEFLGNIYNTDDKETTEYSSEVASDRFALPTYSPYSISILNSYVQAYSAQNYLTLQINKAASGLEETPSVLTLSSLDIYLLNPTTSALGYTFDFSQLECGIPPSNDGSIQPNCRAVPHVAGFKLTFELATTENTQYIWVAWTMGSPDAPYHLPKFLLKADFQYTSTYTFQSLTGITDANRDTAVDSTTSTSSSSSKKVDEDGQISFTTTASALTQGQTIQPLYWDATSPQPASQDDQLPIFMAAHQAPYKMNVFIGEIPNGAEIVFQMTYQNTQNVRTSLAFEITNRDNISPNLIRVKQNPTCLFCVVFQARATGGADLPGLVNIGTLGLDIVYKDTHNSYELWQQKAHLRMAIQTHLSRLQDQNHQIPSTLPGLSTPYSPQLTTVFNFQFTPYFALYQYQTDDIVWYSQTSAATIDAALANENVVFRLVPKSTIDTVPNAAGDKIGVTERYRSTIDQAVYRYTFEGCIGWTPSDSSCTLATDNSGDIECVEVLTGAIATTQIERRALRQFALKAPSKYAGRGTCNLRVDINLKIKTASTTWKDRTLLYNHKIILPPVIPAGRIAFPRNAVSCNNLQSAVFAVGGPGVYNLQIPDGFSVGDYTSTVDTQLGTGVGNKLPYTITQSKTTNRFGRASVDIVVGSTFGSLSDIQEATTIPIFTKIGCPYDERDITSVEWVFSYTPHKAKRNPNLVASTGQSFIPALGYYVCQGDGDVYQEHMKQVTIALEPTVDLYQEHAFVSFYALYTSTRKNQLIVLAPPGTYKYPVMEPYLELSAFHQYSYPTLVADPVTGKAVETIFSFQARLYNDPLTPSTLVFEFPEDVDLFSRTSPGSARFEPSATFKAIQFSGNRDIQVDVGGIVHLFLVAPYEGSLEFQQCLGTQCKSVLSLQWQSLPAPAFTLNFRAQYGQPIQSLFTLSSALQISEIVTIDLVDMNVPFELVQATYEFPTHIVNTSATQIEIVVARYIPSNTPIVILTQVAYSGNTYPTTVQSVSIAFECQVDFSNVLVQPTYDKSPTVSIPFAAPVLSFSLENGFHTSSHVTMKFALGQDFLFGQSIEFSPLPLTQRTITVKTVEGYELAFIGDVYTAEGLQLFKIESAHPTTITAGSIITITVETTPETSVTTIQSIQLSSNGLGVAQLSIQPVTVMTNVPVLPPYTVSFEQVGLPIADTVVTTPFQAPSRNTFTREAQYTPCVPDVLCYYKLSLSEASVAGIPFPTTGLKVSVSFTTSGSRLGSYHLFPNTDESFSGAVTDNYYDGAITNTNYIVKSRIFDYSSQQTVTLEINRASSSRFFYVILPLTFTAPQLLGYIEVSVNHLVNSAPIFKRTIAGPSIQPKTAQPRFFYLQGGAFVGEALTVGISNVGALLGTDFKLSVPQVDALTPAPRYASLKYTGAPNTDFTEIGFTTSNTPQLITGSHVAMVNRAFKPSTQLNVEFMGIAAIETNAALGEVNFDLQAWDSFAEMDALRITFPVVPTLPFDLASSVSNRWSFSTWTNRIFPTANNADQVPPQQPFIRYTGRKITSADTLYGFKVRKQPWLRIVPSLPSIDMETTNYVPQQQYLTLNIFQQWPKREDVDQTLFTFGPEWTEFKLAPTDVLQIVIPEFYSVPTGTYHCDNSTAAMEWNGSFFIFHLEDFTLDSAATTSPSYICTFPISVRQDNYQTYLNSAPQISPELTKSTIHISTMNGNVDTHLPFSSSQEPSPLLSDRNAVPPITTPSEELYLEWYMPQPMLHPRYAIQFQDVNTVGVPGSLVLTIANGPLLSGRVLEYPVDAFPLIINTSEAVDSGCYDDRNVLVADVVWSLVTGLQFTFKGLYGYKDISCSVLFTPTLPLVHHGIPIIAPGSLRLNSQAIGLVDSNPASTIITFISTDSAIIPTTIRLAQPTVYLSGTLIKDLTTRITISGTEFDFQQPVQIDLNGIPTFVDSTLSISVGVPFIAGWGGSITDITGLACVTASGSKVADVSFSFLGQSTSTYSPMVTPPSPEKDVQYANEFGLSGVANRFTLTFVQGTIRPEQTWSCSFDIIPTEEYSQRIPDPLFRTGPTTIQIPSISNLVFKPSVAVDMGFTQGDFIAKTMSSFTFYFNSTALYRSGNTLVDAPEVAIGFPLPLKSQPYDGAQCWLLNKPYFRLPWSIKSASSIDNFYSIPLERSFVPTGQELNKVYCIIPNLSIGTQLNTNRAIFRFGRTIIDEVFSYDRIPSTVVTNSDALVLIANRPSPIRFNITNYDRIYPMIPMTTDSRLKLGLHYECLHDPTVERTDAGAILYDSMYGLITPRETPEGSCYLNITATNFTLPVLDYSNCQPTASTPCVVDTVMWLALPHNAVQTYKVRVNFFPNPITLARQFKPHFIGTPGYVDFNYSGYSNTQSLMVKVYTRTPGFTFDSEIGLLTGQNRLMWASGHLNMVTPEISPYTYETSAGSSTGSNDPKGALWAWGLPSAQSPPETHDWSQYELGSVYQLPMSLDRRFDQIKTLRVTYRGASLSAIGSVIVEVWVAQTAEVDAVIPLGGMSVWFLDMTNPLAPVPRVSDTKHSTEILKPLGTWPGLIQPPTADLTAGIVPWSSFVAITPPAEILRGIVSTWSLTVSNVSPATTGFNAIPLIGFNYNPLEDPADTISADWHIQSPYGKTIIDLPTGSLLTVASACFDYAFSSDTPLISIGIFAIPPDVTKLEFNLIANLVINQAAVETYYQWLQSPASINSPNHGLEIITCTFPLSFISPANFAYATPSALDGKDKSWTAYGSVLEIAAGGSNTMNYLSKNNFWNQYWNFPVIMPSYFPYSLLEAKLDEASHTHSKVGYLTVNAHGVRLTAGDVILIRFVTNTTDASANITNPFDQPYQFAAPTSATEAGVCYNLFYPTALEPAATLVAASPINYSEQLGATSHAFVLRILKGSSGAFPQFSCMAPFTSMSVLPFKGYIVVQRFSEREYLLLSQSLTYPSTYNFDPMYPSCGGKLDSYEQFRWCPTLAGIMADPIKLGTSVVAIPEDVHTPERPVSIKFLVNIAPSRENAILSVDLNEIHFSAFYGCTGVDDVSYYGELGSGVDFGKLRIFMPVIDEGGVVINCSFLSAQYIHPIYFDNTEHNVPELNMDDPVQRASRPSLEIPYTLSLPDPYNNFAQSVVHESSFNFKSTYAYPVKTASLLLPFDRSFLLNRDPSSSILYSHDPYLSLDEITALTTWLQTTISSAVITISNESSAAIFTRIDRQNIAIADQYFEGDNRTTLLVKISLINIRSDRVNSLYAGPFDQVTKWLNGAHTAGLSLDINNALERLNISDESIIQKKYIPLGTIATPSAAFEECVAGACGGNCQPCVAFDPCRVSEDCRYGLYCYLDTQSVSFPHGDYAQAIVKPLLTTAPGICQPLGYGLAKNGENKLALVDFGLAAVRGYQRPVFSTQSQNTKPILNMVQANEIKNLNIGNSSYLTSLIQVCIVTIVAVIAAIC